MGVISDEMLEKMAQAQAIKNLGLTASPEQIAEEAQRIIENSEVTLPPEDELPYEVKRQLNETAQETEPADLAMTTSERLVKNSEAISTTETVSIADIALSPMVFSLGGFFFGALVMFVFFKIRIKNIKAECEMRVSEARASLDRMISMISKENQ